MTNIPPAAYPVPTERIRHTRLGIAAFVISIVVAVVFLLLLLLAGVLAARSGRKPYPGQSLVGAIAILLLAADVVAAGLGIAGICQAHTKRVFAILGTVFSVFTIFGTAGLIVIGLLYMRH